MSEYADSIEQNAVDKAVKLFLVPDLGMLRHLLAILDERGVSRYSTHAMTIEFHPAGPPPTASASTVTIPTTPEQSGKKTTPPMDIHDVLASGVFPGAPVVDPILTTLDE